MKKVTGTDTKTRPPLSSIERITKMTLKEFMEEAIKMLPDNCSAEYFTDDKTAWYSENDIACYLRALADANGEGE